jgi:hypothetical protein
MSEFSKFEEENIILLALESPEFFHRIASFMKAEYFVSEEAQYLMKLYCDYYEKYDEVPTREMVKNMVYKDLTVDDPISKPIIEIIDRELDPRNTPFIKEHIIKWAKQKQISLLYDDTVMERVKAGDFQSIEQIFDDASKISDVIIKPFNFFKDVDQLFEVQERDYFTSGFPRIDREIHDRGPSRREVLAWVAPTGVGKCHTLESKIILEKYSTIYELELDNATIKKYAGFRKILTKRGEIMVCDLTEEDDIIKLPDTEDTADFKM